MVKLPETKNSILELNNGWLTFWFNRPEKGMLFLPIYLEIFEIHYQL